MQRINGHPIIIIILLALWLGTPATRAAAHGGAAAEHFPAPTLTAQASSIWRQKAKQHPMDDLVRAKLGDALMQRARESGDLGYYPLAKSAFQAALRLNAESSAAMIGMAWVHGALHEFDASILWAQKAIALDAGTPEAYGLLGDAAVEVGDYEAAFEYYQTMLDLRPDLASYSRGAHLLFMTGDIEAAMTLMEKAIAAGAPFAENSAWCRAELARMLWSKGALPEAEQVVRRGLEKTPHNYHLLAAMGKVKAARNDVAAAMAAYENAIAVSPRHDAMVALGDLYEHSGQAGKAAALYKRVEKIHHSHRNGGIHGNIPGDILLARFYADHDLRLPLALEEAQKVYQKYKNVFAADTLAWCYYKNGRYQSARNIIEKALRFQTPAPHLWFHAGMIYARLGEPALARRHLKRALGLNSNFHPVFAVVAQAVLSQLEAQSSQHKG